MDIDVRNLNKYMFCFRILDYAMKYGLIPKKVYGERNKTADDKTMAKV